MSDNADVGYILEVDLEYISEDERRDREAPIRKFIGLCPKMYSFILDSGKDKKTAKRMKKSAKEREIRHQDFIDFLFLQITQQLADGFQIRLPSNLHREAH